MSRVSPYPPAVPTMKIHTILLSAAGAMAAVALASCETAEGFGRDLQSVGKGLEKKANSTSQPKPPPPPPAPGTTPPPAY